MFNFIYYLGFNSQEYSKLGVLIVFCLILSSVLVLLSYHLTTTNPDSEKSSAYECGFEPYEDARNVFDIRFYLVAISFLIFDLEAIYFFPWCISFNILNAQGFWYMIDFIVELFIGYIYAWEVGALNWN